MTTFYMGIMFPLVSYLPLQDCQRRPVEDNAKTPTSKKEFYHHLKMPQKDVKRHEGNINDYECSVMAINSREG